MKKPRRIFIVGHMGAGKSLFAEALAKKLAWQVVDANPSIERYIGRSINDILGEHGVAAFNHTQAEIIAYDQHHDNVVVLLEECIASSAQCRQLLSSEFVVYLKVSIPTQLSRMKHGRVPALPVDDLQHFLEKQHHERDAFYEAVATLVVESVVNASNINTTVEDDVNQVLRALEGDKY